MADANGEQERAAKLAELEEETARLKAERKRLEDERKIEAAERAVDKEKQALADTEKNASEHSTKKLIVTKEELSAFFQNNSEYYLTKNEIFESGGGNVSWNWPAFLFTGLWMFYRKMWLYGIVTIIAEWLLYGSIAFAWVGLIVNIICGMMGNNWYVGHVKKKIVEEKFSNKGNHAAFLQLLTEKGGTTWTVVLIIIGIQIVISLIIITAIGSVV
jgi:hypothetical protein